MFKSLVSKLSYSDPLSSPNHSHQFTSNELIFLDFTFDDLKNRSINNKSSIDKTNFLKLFKLPGLVGERLFEVFDTNNNHSIDHDEFLNGIYLLLKGDAKAKIEFIFKMFDMDNTSMLNKEEVRAMLNSIMFANSTILESGNLEVNESVGKINEDIRISEINKNVEELLAIAFHNNQELLSLDQFALWILANPQIFEVFDEVFTSNFGLPITVTDNAPTSPKPSCLVNHLKPTELDVKSSATTRQSSISIGGFDSNTHSECNDSLVNSVKSYRASSLTSPVYNSPGPFSQTLALSFTSSSSPQPAHPTSGRHLNNGFPSGLPKSFFTPPDSLEGIKEHNSDRRPSAHKAKISNLVCANCNLDVKLQYCYHCGTMITNDNKPCHGCGIHFNYHSIKHCFSCGFDLTLNNAKIEPSLKKTSYYQKNELVMQGLLFKLGQTFKQLIPRWYVIKDRFLYSFRDRVDVQPSSVTFLEGCFVEPISSQSDKLRYGFDIIISDSNENEQRKTLFARTKEESDAWVAAIKTASNVHNIEDYYDIGTELGTGKFSSVRLGTHKITGKKYAIKILDKSDMDSKEREALRAEIAILKLVRHPNVIQLKNQFETRKFTFIVMTLFSGGDLFDRLVQKKRFSEPLSRSIVTKLLNVIKYLHDRGIVHRDLKPENIGMVSNDKDDDILIGDFGLSKFAAPHEVMKLPCGTLAYVAPEVLSTKGYGQKIDIWSVGVITYLLLRGKLPFDSRKKEEIVAKSKAGIIDFNDDIWNKVSEDAKDFIRSCLNVDPERRINVSQALTHPFISHVSPPDISINVISSPLLPRFESTVQQSSLMKPIPSELHHHAYCTCAVTQAWISSLWNDFYNQIQHSSVGNGLDSINRASTFHHFKNESIDTKIAELKRLHSNDFINTGSYNFKPYFWDACEICGMNVVLPPFLNSCSASIKRIGSMVASKSYQHLSISTSPSGYESNMLQMTPNASPLPIGNNDTVVSNSTSGSSLGLPAKPN